MRGETSVVVYSLMSKRADLEVAGTKEKFSLNMMEVLSCFEEVV